jgi:hypothetical protein
VGNLNQDLVDLKVPAHHLTAADPDGIRIARNKATILSEALLLKSNFDTSLIDKLLDDLKHEEHACLHRSKAQIASRKKHKLKKSHPNTGYPFRNFLYIDESGKSDDKNNDIFALSGIAVDEEEIDNYKVRADIIMITQTRP